ncbi:uncharacterized protein LOC128547042 [Mercenaria mercenaria]|uniref:uncharacterized protein LOC128547042 n=1 Tax=Mercenaria mercenaria TaxID=6596 RepID=UPI00234F31F0|nr:uncharacterized protein LOC128547042 [Mercenaria mercenaria]
MEKTLIVLLLVLFAIATAQNGTRFGTLTFDKLNLPKLTIKPFSWTLKPLIGNGRPNGLSPPFVKLNLPKLTFKPFSWTLKPLIGSGMPNGLSGTGIWKPPNTRNTFTGTGSWQNGKGFGGRLEGTFGIGSRSSLILGVGGGGGKGLEAEVGFRMRFGRNRRRKRHR